MPAGRSTPAGRGTRPRTPPRAATPPRLPPRRGRPGRRGRWRTAARARAEPIGSLPMIQTPQKIVCVGLNYRDHAEEQGVDLPERPLLFAKWPNTLIASGDAIRIPAISQKVDYEAELGVVIGRRALRVSAADALDHVAGYVVAN